MTGPIVKLLVLAMSNLVLHLANMVTNLAKPNLRRKSQSVWCRLSAIGTLPYNNVLGAFTMGLSPMVKKVKMKSNGTKMALNAEKF